MKYEKSIKYQKLDLNIYKYREKELKINILSFQVNFDLLSFMLKLT